jgi:hypothetical protein
MCVSEVAKIRILMIFCVLKIRQKVLMTQFSATVTSLSQARSQTHEHGGFSDFQCVCLYVHTFTYVYNAALYMYC